jgi:hypothetical protein
VFIRNKISVDSTELHMVGCKEMRSAINKGIKEYSRQNTVPEVQGCYFRNTETAHPAHLTSKPTESEETKFLVKMLHQCRSSCVLTARFPAGTVQENAVFVSKGDVLCIR